MKTLGRALIALLAVVPVVAAASAGSLAAQDVTEVDGTPDFRSPPFLGNGTFSDTIVAGEAVWYAVIYTEDEEYRIEVSVTGVDLATNDELELETSFISPTLGAVQTGSDFIAGTAFLTGDGPETQAWFVKIALNTTGRLGVEHEVVFTIDGVEDGGIDSCLDDPACTLDEDLEALDTELATIRENIEVFEAIDPEDAEAIQREADRLEAETATAQSAITAAEQRTQSAQSETASALQQIAVICAPEADCDEPPSLGSSIVPLLIGGLVLLAGLALLGFRLLRASR